MGLSRFRVVALTIAAVLLVSGSCLSYDRTAALEYALNYWDKVCSDGYYFVESTGPTLLGSGEPFPTNIEGFDCAHFVSCCIGSEPNEPAGGLAIPSRTVVYGEPGAQRLADWLLGQGATLADSISDLVHVALYMGDGLVTAHSLSRYSEWNLDPLSDFVFLHLPGPYEPPLPEQTPSWMSWAMIVAFITGLSAAIFLFSPR